MTIEEIDSLYIEHEAMGEGSDTVTHHRFSVARIAENMPNATPQQLDSVIQRYLPRRDLNISSCPDTLSLPGLPGHAPGEGLLERITNRGFELGFFEGKILHPEAVVRPHGYTAEPVPYSLRNDNWVTSVILLCFVVLMLVFRGTRQQFSQHLREFFFPPREHKGLFSVRTAVENRFSIFLTLQFSLLGGLVSFAYAQYTYDLGIGQVSPYYLLFIYSAGFLCYFAIKNLLYRFVNWVFFERTQQQLWSESITFLFTIESLVFLPVVLVFVYFDLELVKVFFVIALLLFIHRILVLYKAYTIFFPKFYCFLHLFAYLCTLEIVPMLILAGILLRITDSLIIEY